MEAFSILEVTIVIALVALLSTLFFGALSRFGQQVKKETDIRNELNHWFVVRANLWRELDEADSIHVEKDFARIYEQKRTVEYRLMDGRLFRKTGEELEDLQLAMNGIKSEQLKGRIYVTFLFDWKKEEMTLRYPLRSTAATQVNHYFEAALWQQ
jgi:hypothetical protein